MNEQEYDERIVMLMDEVAANEEETAAMEREIKQLEIARDLLIKQRAK